MRKQSKYCLMGTIHAGQDESTQIVHHAGLQRAQGGNGHFGVWHPVTPVTCFQHGWGPMRAAVGSQSLRKVESSRHAKSGPCLDFSPTESNLWRPLGQSSPASYKFPRRRGFAACLHPGLQRRVWVTFSRMQGEQTSLVPPGLPRPRAELPPTAVILPRRRFLWSSWICPIAWFRSLKRVWVCPPSCRCASGDPGPNVHSPVWIWHVPVEINSDFCLLLGVKATTGPLRPGIETAHTGCTCTSRPALETWSTHICSAVALIRLKLKKQQQLSLLKVTAPGHSIHYSQTSGAGFKPVAVCLPVGILALLLWQHYILFSSVIGKIRIRLQ